MDALLDKSVYLNKLPGEHRDMVRKHYKEVYQSLYDQYLSTGTYNIFLLESMASMYKCLGVPYPEDLIEHVKDHLIQGNTLANLDIYDYMPRFAPVVKLLRPEYQAYIPKEDPQVFTCSEHIYNKAITKMKIPLKYENAYSPWFIRKLLDKGKIPDFYDIDGLMSHSTGECVAYLYSLGYKINPEVAAKSCVKTDNVDTLKVVLKDSDVLKTVVSLVKDKFEAYRARLDELDNEWRSLRAKQRNIKVYERKLKAIRRSMPWAIYSLVEDLRLYGETDKYVYTDFCRKLFYDDKRLDIIEYVAEICPMAAANYLDFVIRHKWLDATRVIIKVANVTILDLHNAVTSGYTEMIRLIYNKLSMRIGNKAVLVESAKINCSIDIFKTIYEMYPVDLPSVINLTEVATREVLMFCITKGCPVTKKVVYNYMNKSPRMLGIVIDAYGKVTYNFIKAAILSNNITALECMYGRSGKLHESLLGVAKESGSKEVYNWIADRLD